MAFRLLKFCRAAFLGWAGLVLTLGVKTRTPKVVPLKVFCNMLLNMGPKCFGNL